MDVFDGFGTIKLQDLLAFHQKWQIFQTTEVKVLFHHLDSSLYG